MAAVDIAIEAGHCKTLGERAVTAEQEHTAACPVCVRADSPLMRCSKGWELYHARLARQRDLQRILARTGSQP